MTNKTMTLFRKLLYYLHPVYLKDYCQFVIKVDASSQQILFFCMTNHKIEIVGYRNREIIETKYRWL